MDYKKEVDKICKFIKDTVEDAGAKGVVIGVSGGLDSAVVYKLCVKALDKDKMYSVYIPYSEPTPYQLPKGIEKLEKQTKDTILFNTDLGYCLDAFPPLDKLIVGNIQARLRMTFLYSYANQRNYLVAGTTNKSEYMIGYFTKYGDGACDFEPIQHLYKTEVYELARYLKVPQSIIDAKPSAGLWKGQTDEGEIGMSYEKLDKILKWLDDGNGIGYNTNPKGCTIKDVRRVNRMILSSEHKRRLPRCLEP